MLSTGRHASAALNTGHTSERCWLSIDAEGTATPTHFAMICVVEHLDFFPDDVADPLWDADHPAWMVPLDSLPLRKDTRQALRAWSRRWAVGVDRTIWAGAVEAGMSDRASDPVSCDEWELAEREGRGLFERVKAELGPGWTVDGR